MLFPTTDIEARCSTTKRLCPSGLLCVQNPASKGLQLTIGIQLFSASTLEVQPAQPWIFWLIWSVASEPNCEQQGAPGAWIGQVPTKTPIHPLWYGFCTQNPRTCNFPTWRPAKPRTGMTVNLPSTHYHEFMSWLWFIMPLLNWRCLSSGREVHLSLTWETCMYPLKSHHLISRSPFGVFPSVCMCVCVCVCVCVWKWEIALIHAYSSEEDLFQQWINSEI